MQHPYPLATRVRRTDGTLGTVLTPEHAILGTDVERFFHTNRSGSGKGAYFVTWDDDPDGVAVATEDQVEAA